MPLTVIYKRNGERRWREIETPNVTEAAYTAACERKIGSTVFVYDFLGNRLGL